MVMNCVVPTTHYEDRAALEPVYLQCPELSLCWLPKLLVTVWPVKRSNMRNECPDTSLWNILRILQLTYEKHFKN